MIAHRTRVRLHTSGHFLYAPASPPLARWLRQPERANSERPLPDQAILEDLEVRRLVGRGPLELDYDPGY